MVKMNSKLPTISELIQDVKESSSTKQKQASYWSENKKKHSLEANQLLRINELSKLTTLSKSCINLWVAQGKLIPPITLSSTVKVWKLQDVINWLDAQKES
jgi:predicted DNA-binding transcriptional regulator AlpA